ncbi:head completion/stabilization protein [Sphingomonas sp.]|uniref:head completion/stabilization protein n=1 Tax=Sphingomonas sp. TaxID=28214 RepID=UPI000DBBC02D|nr:head completion/stabilization protein [Sphingomonas sp.]PZT91673.1 MAG: head completion/stabilization protein [Sphingomonas sp.]
MSGFGTIGGTCLGSVLPEAATTVEGTIADDWYPAIDLDQLRRDHRIGTVQVVTPARLRAAVQEALLSIDNQVGAQAAAWEAAGHATLADVPTKRLAGTSRLVIAFHRAVAALTKAELIERHRDLDTTAGGDRDAGALDPSIAELRRDAAHAIRDIRGEPRAPAELL